MSDLSDWVLALFFGLGAADPTAYNGYAEAEYIYVAPSAAGRISAINAVEGAQVSAGDVLFRIDDSHQTAALRAAEAQVAVAQANLENLETGSRTAEVAVIRASLDQALADQQLAQSTLKRSQQLFDSGSISKVRVDVDAATLQSATARVAQLEAQLEVAELPAREAQRIAAAASHAAAVAQRDDASLALADRQVEAPTHGVIDKVYFNEGEVAGAGVPIVSILPPDTLSALFFVPEARRADMQPGDILDVTCSNCPPDLVARVTRIAATPQYTPPIIYSREERSRLVFRAEADLESAGSLLPGQPLTLFPRK
jgi:HlyD family secretion protein